MDLINSRGIEKGGSMNRGPKLLRAPSGATQKKQKFSSKTIKTLGSWGFALGSLQ